MTLFKISSGFKMKLLIVVFCLIRFGNFAPPLEAASNGSDVANNSNFGEVTNNSLFAEFARQLNNDSHNLTPRQILNPKNQQKILSTFSSCLSALSAGFGLRQGNIFFEI